VTEDELIAELSRRYHQADTGWQVIEIHLFAIEFAKQLNGHALKRIAEAATGKKSYGTELRKGINLSAYVVLKEQE
jgi:hypothetical protein